MNKDNWTEFVAFIAVAVLLGILFLVGCAGPEQRAPATRPAIQGTTGDIFPRARWVSPDVDAPGAQLGGQRGGAGAQVVEVHTNGLATMLVALGGTVLLGLVFGVLLYRSRPPDRKETKHAGA